MKMLPWNRPLNNFEIEDIIQQTPLRSIFRGTFSLDELAKLRPRRSIEAGIINLSKSHQRGTHWTAWFKHPKNKVCYFDSFGDLRPPYELVNYLSNCKIYYNVNREQEFNTVCCGQLCLCFLMKEFIAKSV